MTQSMRRVVSALMFFPRGGSATVARALARRLPAHDWDVTVVSGSLPGHGDAERYYAGLDVRPACFAPHGDTPMHPSFEERPGAPDVVFASLDDAAYERHVEAWARHLDAAGAARADVLHLHHLTPLHEAAARTAPGVPVISHLHGTELLMLEEIEEGAGWAHAEAWARRLRDWAERSHTLLVLSPSQIPRVERLLGVDAGRCVVVPNGVDLDRFRHEEVDRAALWRTHLAEDPRGWAPGGEEGSIAYTRADAERVAAHPVVLYVGRFTKVKRVGVLIRAWARARAELPGPASLVLVGGHPGEWEGEHPAEVVAATGAPDVFLAGWHPHEELPAFLSAADALALPSVREQFGAVLVEAMACGVPPIAVDRYGPAAIVEDGATGWLVEPDDEASLAAALVHALSDPAECRRRGTAARRVAEQRYGWDAIAKRLAGVYDAVATGSAPNGLRNRG